MRVPPLRFQFCWDGQLVCFEHVESSFHVDKHFLLFNGGISPPLICSGNMAAFVYGLVHPEGESVCEFLQDQIFIWSITGMAYQKFKTVDETIQIASFHLDATFEFCNGSFLGQDISKFAVKRKFSIVPQKWVVFVRGLY